MNYYPRVLFPPASFLPLAGLKVGNEAIILKPTSELQAIDAISIISNKREGTCNHTRFRC